MVKLQTGKVLSSNEVGVLTFLSQAEQLGTQMFISPETVHLLQRYAGRAQFDLPYSRVVLPRLATPNAVLEYANNG
jgi:hypothetical protein